MAATDQVTENHEHAPDSEKTNLEDQVVNFLQERQIPITKQDISTCHTLPSNIKSKPKPIVIRMVSRKSKVEVLRNSKKLKDSNVYVNEHLTTKNAAIAKNARILRKRGNIISTWTRNCKVFIKAMIEGEPKVLQISNMDELRKFDNQDVQQPRNSLRYHRSDDSW